MILIHFIATNEIKLIDWLMLMSFKSFSINHKCYTKPSLYLITHKKSLNLFILFSQNNFYLLKLVYIQEIFIKIMHQCVNNNCKRNERCLSNESFSFHIFFLYFFIVITPLCKDLPNFIFFLSECYNVNSVTHSFNNYWSDLDHKAVKKVIQQWINTK